ncbi:iron-containing alcohol dehydrogenase [Paraliomyxa miuraensis]|uniref:iron-containing alcohol dehydrogenase n=1 Tax=Paraliomyxa miuraensis TaxID=376150 RepID=UPI002255CA86|nr:iron-containing alcohol dehydrogenase [Paraliomyxa miuraensis]MCX4240412.1 homogentisate 1,2-dioxygenase [Paraliomyxa miuraensis]
MTSEGPTTFFGADALADAIAWLRDQGAERPLVISSPSQRYVDEVEACLSGLTVRRFAKAEVHVPRTTVLAAMAAFTEHRADAIITVGGGSATGLGKALRLQAPVPFVAIPTTYAGSEMTRIHGITDDGHKQTGRDDRVRPDVVAYVPRVLDTMPADLTVQSLLNAMAHPVSALSTGTLDEAEQRRALRVITRLFRATLKLADHPQHRTARLEAARGIAEAASILDEHAMGSHHRVAHALGGRFGLPHAALHGVLLPATLAGLPPQLRRAVLDAMPEADPLASLFDALVAVGAPTSIAALGVPPDRARAALEQLDDVASTAWVEPALIGRRPSVHVRWQAWDHGPPLSVFGRPETATDVVLAVHGRGSTADAIVQRARELLGDAPGFAVVAPQSDGRAWYEALFRTVRTDEPASLEHALQRLRAALAFIEQHAPRARVHLMGFSQGACVALELTAQGTTPGQARFASVLVLAGTRIGPDAAPPIAPSLRDVPVLLAIARSDRWATIAEVEATAAALTEAGARAELLLTPGNVHEIGGRARIRARELLLGRSAHEGSHGLHNAHASEALPGALPRTQNSPRRAPHGLYPEQISGTGFVTPRRHNQRTWVYRLRPSAGHRAFSPLPHPTFDEAFADHPPEANLVGHGPLPFPEVPTDFIDGMHTYGGQGRAALRRGCAIHLYVANRSMEHRAFYDGDGDLLVVPQQGGLTLRTELGVLDVLPGHIAVIPRGIVFSVLLHDERARGWVGEVFGRHFELPERGVVGANGLADERHFRAPSAWFEDRPDPGFRLTAKLGGALHETTRSRSPFDVVAWHGNYTPYAYDLSLFSPVSNTAFDHIDPSAYLVLTSPLDESGADALDLVVFPARWDVTEHTFRPPFFHRNAITEFNGIVREAVGPGSPFEPGQSFLTPSMTAHGVLDRAVERAIDQTDEQADRATRTTGHSLWFQFESALPLSLSPWAQTCAQRVHDWPDVWGRYRGYYRPPEG